MLVRGTEPVEALTAVRFGFDLSSALGPGAARLEELLARWDGETAVVRRDRETGAKKYIPRTKYDTARDLWAQVGGGKTVTADQAPVYTEPEKASASSGETKSSGHSADTTKES